MPGLTDNNIINGAYKFYRRSYYYHVCVINRSGDYNAVKRYVSSILRKFDVIAVGFDNNPFAHAHVLIRSSRRLNIYDFISPNLFIKLIPVKNKTHFMNLLTYIHGHPKKYINLDGHIRDGDSMSGNELAEIKTMLVDIQRRLDTIENRIDTLENDVKAVKTETTDKSDKVERKTLADKISERQERRMEERRETEPERIEVRTRVATFIFQRSRKGVAVRIRFAGFVKPNSKGEYYLSLNHDEFKALAVQVQNALESFGSSESGGKNSGNRKTNVKVNRGKYL